MYENPSQLDHSSTHRQVALYEDPSIFKQQSMALQQGHSAARHLDSHENMVASCKDQSQVAPYEDPNSNRFDKDSSKLVVLPIQYCDYTHPRQAQQTQDDAHQRRGSCLAQQPPQGGRRAYT